MQVVLTEHHILENISLRDTTIAGKGFRTAFEQRGMFIVPYLLWHGTSVSFKKPLCSVAFLLQARGTEELFLLGYPRDVHCYSVWMTFGLTFEYQLKFPFL